MSNLLLVSAFDTAIDTPEFVNEAAPLVMHAGKMGLILAAGDYNYKLPDGTYTTPNNWIEKDTAFIKQLGGTAEYLDFRVEDIEPEQMQEYGGFWVGGGNPLVLAQRLRESTLGQEIAARHERGTLLYIAESAGAVVAANNTRYIWEVPSFTKVNTKHFRELIAFNKGIGRAVSGAVGLSKGLGLTDVKIVPHQDTVNPPQHLIHITDGEIVYLRDGDYYSHAHGKIRKR